MKSYRQMDRRTDGQWTTGGQKRSIEFSAKVSENQSIEGAQAHALIW